MKRMCRLYASCTPNPSIESNVHRADEYCDDIALEAFRAGFKTAAGIASELASVEKNCLM